MKRLLILLPIMMLQGCLYQSVTATDMYYANKYCEEMGSKVKNISEWFSGAVNIYCEAGENVSLETYTNEVLKRNMKEGDDE